MTFRLKKKRPIFSEEETSKLVAAIRAAELQTSGEIRVFVETRCRYVDAIDRAEQVFQALKMSATKLRNGILFYVATKDKQLAIYGDKGIHESVKKEYWQALMKQLIATIHNKDIIEGLSDAIKDAGKALATHFPYNADTDKNELPDDIVFGD